LVGQKALEERNLFTVLEIEVQLLSHPAHSLLQRLGFAGYISKEMNNKTHKETDIQFRVSLFHFTSSLKVANIFTKIRCFQGLKLYRQIKHQFKLFTYIFLKWY
jgi:hypothetical protein